MASEERQIQRLIISYLAARGVWVHHSPNGAHLAGNSTARFKQSAALKADGSQPGFADLLLIKPSPGGTRVAFLEVKSRTGKLSPQQKAFATLCENWKMPHAVVRSVDDCANCLKEWGW